MLQNAFDQMEIHVEEFDRQIDEASKKENQDCLVELCRQLLILRREIEQIEDWGKEHVDI